MLSLSDDAITAWAVSSGGHEGNVPNASTGDTALNEPVKKALSRLAETLSSGCEKNASGLAIQLNDPITVEEIGRLLGRSGARVSLRVIAWLTEELPGGPEVAANLIDHRGVDGVGNLLAESERSVLLRRLYDPERLRTLERACRAAQAISEAA